MFYVDDIYLSGYLESKKIIKKIIHFPHTEFTLFINKLIKKDIKSLHLQHQIDKNTTSCSIRPLKNINKNVTDSYICVKYFFKNILK